GLATLGTGIEAPTSEEAVLSRKCRIDGEPVSSSAAFADHLSVLWLTPAIEHETAEIAVAVAAARAETVRRLSAAISASRDPASPFPWAGVALDGWIE